MNDDKRADGRQAAHHSPACSTAPNAPDKPDRPDRPGGPVRPDKSDQGTRERLLAAAAEVFAEHGYKSATVREICRRAGANVAAVNYHFGSKEQLYIRVLYEHIRQMRTRYPIDAGVTPDSPPVDRLRAFVQGLLQQLLASGDEQDARLGKMILLEMVQPSQHVDVLIEELIRPLNEALRGIIAQLLPKAPACVVTRCAAGVMSQFTLFRFDPRVLATVGPDFLPREENLLAVADTILEFSLGGIERLRAKYASCPAPLK